MKEYIRTTTNQENILTEQKENIKRIEELRIGKLPKAYVILVVLGLKPATEVDLFKRNDKPEDVRRTLEQSGLIIKAKDIKGQKNVVAKFVVAKDPVVADKLLLLDPAKDDEEYGKMMGYPKTAYKAHANRKEGTLLMDADYYPLLKKEGIVFSFKLSKKHWQEELETLREWNEAIKQYAPDLYDKLKGK